MTTKTIIVLANSVKKSGRCLAGKEISWTDGYWKAGGWIRPVTSPEGGEVGLYSMKQALGREPLLLEILEMPLESPAPQPDQPENWLLSRTGVWKSHGHLKFDDLPPLLDQPDNLWGTNQRYVESGFPQRMAQPASLYLILPEEITPLRVWTEEAVNEEGRQYERHRRRVTLRYRGAFHEFDITDPQLQVRYYPKLPAKNDPSLTIPLRAPKKTAVCVSLTPLWQGRHYKLAAAFVEPPETKT
jgi:hypothetical protein